MKYRIVLLFDNSDKQKIIDLNKQINQGINPDIIFNSTCIPHITLASGYLKHDIETVNNVIQNSIYLLTTPILETTTLEYSDDGEWLFINVAKTNDLENFIVNLRQNLTSCFDMSERRKTHITIAKSKCLQNRNNLIKNLQIPKEINVSGVAIGVSGEYGTLVNIEKFFKIKTNKK
ncbi:MAG: hypothetical protein IKM43_04095 [Clostridia bacterium]|nr:hypothetical protein [Clostridia bacterium]